MILEAEIRRLAAAANVDPMVMDLDYSLGWFLSGLASIHNITTYLVFKGGTCLRKCYFNGYRFSEDLDFTCLKYISPRQILTWVEQISSWSAELHGPNFNIEPARLEIVEDDYGKESLQVRVYYRGPLSWGGSLRAIRMDITQDEKVLLAPEIRGIAHAFSDVEDLGSPTLACYTLPEILSEKIRAIAGQRRFAISRDLYDIHHLVGSGVDVDDVFPLVLEKFKLRGMQVSAIDPMRFMSRKAEFERDWRRRLNYLISKETSVSFENAWLISVQLLNEFKKKMGC